MAVFEPAAPPDTFRGRAYEIIFGHEPGWGRWFDAILIALILASVGAVMLDSVAAFRARYRDLLVAIEWGFTILFTAEYLMRLWCVRSPRAYAVSFFGVIDLLSACG